MAGVDPEYEMDIRNYSPRNVSMNLTCQVCKVNHNEQEPNGKVFPIYYGGPNISPKNSKLNKIGYLVCENETCQVIINKMKEQFEKACKVLKIAGIWNDGEQYQLPWPREQDVQELHLKDDRENRGGLKKFRYYIPRSRR